MWDEVIISNRRCGGDRVEGGDAIPKHFWILESFWKSEYSVGKA